MADDDTVLTTDRPLAHLAEVERNIDPPRETPAVDRLRAFEDEKIGKDCVRINGLIERGSGSPYQALSPEDKARYAALQRLIETEQKLADAHAALLVAEADHEEALKAADA